MFHRIQVEQWQHVLSIVSFCLFFGTFVLSLIRVFWMSRKDIQHLESLPLAEEESRHE